MSDFRVSVMEEKHMLSILLYLYRNGRTTKGEMYSNISNNPRMPLKLNILKDAGLVLISEGIPANIVLTDKGMAVASSIDRMENDLQ